MELVKAKNDGCRSRLKRSRGARRMDTDQPREFAEQSFPFRQGQADLISRQPDHAPLDPSDLNGLDVSQAAPGLELRLSTLAQVLQNLA